MTYELIIKKHLRLTHYWTIILLGLIFLAPIFSGLLFGISGLAGLCIIIFPCALILDMGCSNIGYLWQYINLSSIKEDSVGLADISYSSLTNQLFL